MKKIIYMLTVAVLLVGCDKKEEQVLPTETTTEIIDLDDNNELNEENGEIDENEEIEEIDDAEGEN